MVLGIGNDAHLLADPSLDEAFDVNRAGGISVEAVGEGVPEGVEMEVLGTPPVGPVEKRTVVLLVSHAGLARPNPRAAPLICIGAGERGA
jgi:hypothetical protein